ncbi:MAG: hypothetical protein HPY59_15815 [Anaerolineae bacterium]|nr:hypothetical protein [Anaerolineae bacterium]
MIVIPGALQLQRDQGFFIGYKFDIFFTIIIKMLKLVQDDLERLRLRALSPQADINYMGHFLCCIGVVLRMAIGNTMGKRRRDWVGGHQRGNFDSAILFSLAASSRECKP